MKTNILTFLLALTFLLFFSSSVFGQKPEVKNENTSKAKNPIIVNVAIMSLVELRAELFYYKVGRFNLI